MLSCCGAHSYTYVLHTPRTIRLENGIVVLLISDQRVRPSSHGRVRSGKGRRRHASSEVVAEGEDGKGWETTSEESLDGDSEDSEEECSGSEVDGPSKAAEEEMGSPIQVRGRGMNLGKVVVSLIPRLYLRFQLYKVCGY